MQHLHFWTAYAAKIKANLKCNFEQKNPLLVEKVLFQLAVQKFKISSVCNRDAEQAAFQSSKRIKSQDTLQNGESREKGL